MGWLDSIDWILVGETAVFVCLLGYEIVTHLFTETVQQYPDEEMIKGMILHFHDLQATASIEIEHSHDARTFNYLNLDETLNSDWEYQKLLLQAFDTGLTHYAENLLVTDGRFLSAIERNTTLLSEVRLLPSFLGYDDFLAYYNRNGLIRMVGTPYDSAALNDIMYDFEGNRFYNMALINPLERIRVYDEEGRATGSFLHIGHSWNNRGLRYPIFEFNFEADATNTYGRTRARLVDRAQGNLGSLHLSYPASMSNDGLAVRIFPYNLMSRVNNTNIGGFSPITGTLLTLDDSPVPNTSIFNCPQGTLDNLFVIPHYIPGALSEILSAFKLHNYNEDLNGIMYKMDLVNVVRTYIRLFNYLGCDLNAVNASCIFDTISNDVFFQEYCEINNIPNVQISKIKQAILNIENELNGLFEEGDPRRNLINELTAPVSRGLDSSYIMGGANSPNIVLDVVRFFIGIPGSIEEGDREISRVLTNINNLLHSNNINKQLKALALIKRELVHNWPDTASDLQYRELVNTYSLENPRIFYELVNQQFGTNFNISNMEYFETNNFLNRISNYFYRGGELTDDVLNEFYNTYIRSMLDLSDNNLDYYVDPDSNSLNSNLTLANDGDRGFRYLRRFELEVGNELLSAQGLDPTEHLLPGYRDRAVLTGLNALESSIISGFLERENVHSSIDEPFNRWNLIARNLIEHGALRPTMDDFNNAWAPLLEEAFPITTDYFYNDMPLTRDRNFLNTLYEDRISNYDYARQTAMKLYIETCFLNDMLREQYHLYAFNEELLGYDVNSDIYRRRSRVINNEHVSVLVRRLVDSYLDRGHIFIHSFGEPISTRWSNGFYGSGNYEGARNLLIEFSVNYLNYLRLGRYAVSVPANQLDAVTDLTDRLLSWRASRSDTLVSQLFGVTVGPRPNPYTDRMNYEHTYGFVSAFLRNLEDLVNGWSTMVANVTTEHIYNSEHGFSSFEEAIANEPRFDFDVYELHNYPGMVNVEDDNRYLRINMEDGSVHTIFRGYSNDLDYQARQELIRRFHLIEGGRTALYHDYQFEGSRDRILMAFNSDRLAIDDENPARRAFLRRENQREFFHIRELQSYVRNNRIVGPSLPHRIGETLIEVYIGNERRQMTAETYHQYLTR